MEEGGLGLEQKRRIMAPATADCAMSKGPFCLSSLILGAATRADKNCGQSL